MAALNAFRPRLLVGYASALHPLAEAQQGDVLRVSPQRVMSASEVLTDAAASAMRRAWGTAPVDVYAATETAGVGSPCLFGTSHLYEDLLVVEPVDAAGRPVPAGVEGSRVWVSVLFSRTLPLIRYELTDRMVLGGLGCACRRPFRVLARVEGRTEDVLALRAGSGLARVHPNVFHDVLDALPTAGWQVRQDGASALTVLLAGSSTVPMDTIAADVASAVVAAGADRPQVRVRAVTAIPRTPLGKTPLVVAMAAAPGTTRSPEL